MTLSRIANVSRITWNTTTTAPREIAQLKSQLVAADARNTELTRQRLTAYECAGVMADLANKYDKEAHDAREDRADLAAIAEKLTADLAAALDELKRAHAVITAMSQLD